MLNVADRISYTAYIKYDTMRYGRLTCAQKLTRWELNITHGTETKKLGKKWKQKPSSSEEKRPMKVVRGEEVKLRGL